MNDKSTRTARRAAAGNPVAVSIAEASRASGVGEHALRYYDRLGLLPGLRRASGRRQFTGQDLAALSLVVCLRDTGMPLKTIREFMSASGPGTPDVRLAILRRHRDDVAARIEEYRRAARRVDFIIGYYEEAKRRGGVAKLPPLDELLEQYRRETKKSTNW